MNKLFFVLFFYISFSYGQKKDLIFRIEGHNYSTIYSYDITVLKLYDDQEYRLINQKFGSKKLARKNIPGDYRKESGIWIISADTLKLIPRDNGREMHFIKKKNYLIYISPYSPDRSTYHWKQVDY